MNPHPAGPAPTAEEQRLQQSRIQGMRTRVYSQPDPSSNEDWLRELAEQEARVRQPKSGPAETVAVAGAAPSPSPVREYLMGPETTGLQVTRSLKMQPLPTGIYHLLNPEREPEKEVLAEVTVRNQSRDTKRICVTAYIEGLSAQAVQSDDIPPNQTKPFHLLPTLLPGRSQMVREVQRATLHMIVDDLDGKVERHDTVSIVCLARNSSFNAVCRPATGELIDLSHYYGAWVTPYAERVQERIRRAADLLPARQIWGYQGGKNPDVVAAQVKALYQSLQEVGIVYVNSVIDYGAPPGMFTQRTRLPRESISLKSANCIDGTVLMASLLEGASLNPAIVLVPGHAFLGWETWPGTDEWKCLETTLIGRAPFEEACQSGQRQYDAHPGPAPSGLKMHPLSKLRADGIWPME